MKYILYGNGGSGNHGCEAIIRGTKAILGEEMIILSQTPEEDKKYDIEELATILPAISPKKNSADWLKAYLKLKITGNYTDMDGIAYMPAIRHIAGTAPIALSVGGDNYCYNGTGLYAYLNQAYHKNGFKTVLWGCSVEPEVVKEPKVAQDLSQYDLIVARESISYEALKSVNKNTVLAPDPAFFMDAAPCELPVIFEKGHVIGINISPMIISNENQKGVTYQNYLELIRYILSNTDCSVALIPHVVWQTNDDRTVLQKLYEDIDNDKRVTLIPDHTAPELKYLISHCECFVGARTHATIAAYSTTVPTLVVGYSVKARGIAKDLFGTTEGYVIPVQSLVSSEQLVSAFSEIYQNREAIKKHLEAFLPPYKSNTEAIKNSIFSL